MTTINTANIHPASVGFASSDKSNAHPASIESTEKVDTAVNTKAKVKIKDIAIQIFKVLGCVLAGLAIGAAIGFGIGSVLGLIAGLGFGLTAPASVAISAHEFGMAILAFGVIGAGVAGIAGSIIVPISVCTDNFKDYDGPTINLAGGLARGAEAAFMGGALAGLAARNNRRCHRW